MSDRPPDDVVLAAWAPAGWGRIVVVLGQGVVIHKFVVSAKAAAIGIAENLTIGAGGDLDDRETVIADAVDARQLRRSPFIEKVLRNGVGGLLASPRKTLIRWEEIESAEIRMRALYRGRMVIRTSSGRHTLKFLLNTVVVGDRVAVLNRTLGDRFSGPPPV